MSGSTARKTCQCCDSTLSPCSSNQIVPLQGSAKALVPEFRRCAAGENEGLLRFGESIGPYLRYRNPAGKCDMQFGISTLLHRDVDSCRMRDNTGLGGHHNRSRMVV
jgi:hypothetical protein